MSQKQKAEHFLKLHHSRDVLVLPCAWDAATARIFEATGHVAIGTTGAGICASLGVPNERATLKEMLEVITRICRAVKIPVSADIDRGYGNDDAAIVETVKQVVEAGAVGINIEDACGKLPAINHWESASGASLQDVAVFSKTIRAIREFSSSIGIHIVINARTDVYLESIGEPQSRLEHTISRANAYHEAGADCVFIPGKGLYREDIRKLVKGIRCPINISANPTISLPMTPSVSELQDLGVKRVSVGAAPQAVILAVVEQMANELRMGTYDTMVRELMVCNGLGAYSKAIGRSK